MDMDFNDFDEMLFGASLLELSSQESLTQQEELIWGESDDVNAISSATSPLPGFNLAEDLQSSEDAHSSKLDDVFGRTGDQCSPNGLQSSAGPPIHPPGVRDRY